MTYNEIERHLEYLDVKDMKRNQVFFCNHKSFDKKYKKITSKKYQIDSMENAFAILTRSGRTGAVFTDKKIYYQNITLKETSQYISYSYIKSFQFIYKNTNVSLYAVLYNGAYVNIYNFQTYLFNEDALNIIIDLINFCTDRKLKKFSAGISSEKKIIDTSQPYIFVSYRHEDYLPFHIEQLINMIEQKGIQVWYDEDIPVGSDWDNEITSRLNGCSLFLALIGNSYNNSEYCREELKIALETQKHIIPIRLIPNTVITSSVPDCNITISESDIDYFNSIQIKEKYKYTENELYDIIAYEISKFVSPSKHFTESQKLNEELNRKRKKSIFKTYFFLTIVLIIMIPAIILMYSTIIKDFIDTFSDSSVYDNDDSDGDMYWTDYFDWDENDFFKINNIDVLFGLTPEQLAEKLDETLDPTQEYQYIGHPDGSESTTYEFDDNSKIEFVFFGNKLSMMIYTSDYDNNFSDIIDSATKLLGESEDIDDEFAFWESDDYILYASCTDYYIEQVYWESGSYYGFMDEQSVG